MGGAIVPERLLFPRRAATALVCLILALAIYRAKTQSFTVDEAYTFNLFVDRELAQFARFYDACNHVLHTLLTKFVRYMLGSSELVLRIGSLIGALLYLMAARRLSRLAAGGGWIHVLGFAALALNPLILDFMVAARGYGLAVALFLWAIYYAVRWLNEGREAALLRRAGIAAGLAIAANLTLLVPSVALGLILLVIGAQGRFWSVIDNYGGPAVVLAFLFLVFPLARSTPEHFYLGANSLAESIDSLWDASFRYHEWRSALPDCDACLIYGRHMALPVGFVLLTAAAAAVLFRRLGASSSDFSSDLLILSTLTLAVSIAIVWLLHRYFAVPLPVSRSGLYWLPLATLSLLSASGLLIRSRRTLQLGYATAGVLAISAAMFVAQLNTRYFSVWRFDASTNRLARVIAADRQGRESEPFVVASSKFYAESLKYYRKRLRLRQMAEEVITEDIENTSAEYFVLTPADRELVDKLNLRVLAEDDFSGGIVARRL
jgi:hypothetical protein